MRTYLLTGACGSGKTWVMKQLIAALDLKKEVKEGMYIWKENEDVAVLGKYDGSTFEGSDRLSMAIMRDNERAIELLKGKTVIAEGDRFTNSTFLKDFNPIIIRIKGTGADGRFKRGTNQSEQHIKSILSRVNNFHNDKQVESSADALILLLAEITNPSLQRKATTTQSGLF